MNNQNPWDVLPQVQQSKQPYQEVAEKFPEIAPKQEAKNPWDMLPKAPETTGESVLRQGAQYTTRALEALYGLPGEFEKAARSLVNAPTRKLPYEGEDFKKPEPLLAKESFLPGIAELREHGREKSGDKLEPKDEKEARIGEIVQKAVIAPGGPLSRLAVALGSNMVKDIAGAYGADEKGQAITDMVSSFALSRVSAPTVRNYYTQQYNLAEGAIPRAATIPGGRAQGFLNAVRQRLDDGGFAAWKAPVREQLNALETNIRHGQINVRSLTEAQRNINHQLRTPNLDPNAQRQLTLLNRGVRRQLREYGANNPRFLEHWRNANSAYAGWARSQVATNFMDRNIGRLAAGGGSALLYNFLHHGPELTAQTVAAMASTYGIATVGQFMSRVFANRTLFNYYMRTMTAAASENLPQMVSNYNKLDKELKKENKQSNKKQ